MLIQDQNASSGQSDLYLPCLQKQPKIHLILLGFNKTFLLFLRLNILSTYLPVTNTSNTAFSKVHYISCECTSFVRENVLNLKQNVFVKHECLCNGHFFEKLTCY